MNTRPQTEVEILLVEDDELEPDRSLRALRKKTATSLKHTGAV